MNDDLVREARIFFSTSRSFKQTRERYGLGHNACRQMLMGTTWSHVPFAISRQEYAEIVNRKVK